MQASVRKTDRAVMQFGQSLGVRPDALVVELTEQNETDLRAAYDQPHGLVYLSVTGVVTFDPYVAPTPPPQDSQTVSDREQVTAFMNAFSGSATAVQRDDTIKAVVRYLRRMGQDA